MSYEALEPVLAAWTHSDPRGLANASDVALERASAGSWQDSREALSADLRALVLRSIVAAGLLTEVSLGGGSKLTIPDLSHVAWKSAEHLEFGSALLRTIRCMAGSGVPSFPAVSTVGGGAATRAATSEDAAGWPYVAAFAVVVGAAAYVYSAVYTAEQTQVVLDRSFRRKDTGEKLLQVHSALLKLVEFHAEQEALAKAILPFSVAEKAAWAALLQEQAHFLAETANEKPLPPPNSGGFGAALGGGLGLAAVAVLALVISRR